MKKIKDKLAKVNDSFIVYNYDNGFMFEMSGRDSNNDYKNTKIVVTSIEELVALVKEATTLPKDE
jgi:hypothetical protein